MKQVFRSMNVCAFIGVIIFFTFAGSISSSRAQDDGYFFKVSKSIEIFGRVYKEVALNYVDEIDPEKFMEAGLDGLLGTLDPYTRFINEKEGDEIELITSGKYGGIGITIGSRDDHIIITGLMEGYSAERQGLQPGDKILEINGTPLKGLKPEDVRSLTRGEPGTIVHISVERDGEEKPLEFDITREEIHLKNITYADYIDNGIAYVRLERFSRTAGDELRVAIKDLRLRGELKGLILDLRDNPGGLLDVAVDIVEKFVPKGSLVVSTRGRSPESEKKYVSSEEPMLPALPLVILVNRNSASASEIVAGAVQDLDRGVIIGSRTFGKGLVQTITPLAYNTQLKITTGKYYTPSGRCIQEINYLHQNPGGVFAITPDSLRHEFKTSRGRTVFELGGIHPDTTVELPEPGPLLKELVRRSMYLKFANRFALQFPLLPPGFQPDDSLMTRFRGFLDEQKFIFTDEGELKVKELLEIASRMKYNPDVLQEIEHLRARLDVDKTVRLEKDKSEILSALNTEIIRRYQGERGRIAVSLIYDIQVSAARGLLLNSEEYNRRLAASLTR